MRNLLTLVGAAVVTFAVVGWFLGWYKVDSAPGPDGHRRVDFDINLPKVKDDIGKGKQRILGGTQQTAGGTNPAVPGEPVIPPPVPTVPQAQGNPPPSGQPVVVRPVQVPATDPF